MYKPEHVSQLIIMLQLQLKINSSIFVKDYDVINKGVEDQEDEQHTSL